MDYQAKTTSSLPKNFEELNEEWEEKHKNHSVIKFKHTEFKNYIGTKYECKLCTTCDLLAKRKAGSSITKLEKFTKPGRSRKRKTVNKIVAGFKHLD